MVAFDHYSRKIYTVHQALGITCRPVSRGASSTNSPRCKECHKPYERKNEMHALVQIALNWASETTSEDSRVHLVDFLTDAIERFNQNETTNKNDEVMLPIFRTLVRHQRNLVYRGLLYQRLYEEHCFKESAAFYRDWAEALLSEGMEKEAVNVCELARLNNATPLKMIDCLEHHLTSANFDLRERVMQTLGDITLPVHRIIRNEDEPATLYNFTEDELCFVFSSSTMSEVLLYLGAAVAPPAMLAVISDRIGAIRVISACVDACEPK